MSDENLTLISLELEKSVKNDCVKDITVAFSGGIDSTLVAFLAKKYSDTIIENSKLNSKKFDNFLTSAFKNKVLIHRVRLNLKKALKNQEKVY